MTTATVYTAFVVSLKERTCYIIKVYHFFNIFVEVEHRNPVVILEVHVPANVQSQDLPQSSDSEPEGQDLQDKSE